MDALSFSITTAADGSYTATSKERVYNRFLYRIELVNTDFAAGVDVVVSVVNTPSGVDETLLTLTDADASIVKYPRVATHDNAGALTGGLDYFLVDGNIKVAVSSGGNAKTGALSVRLF